MGGGPKGNDVLNERASKRTNIRTSRLLPPPPRALDPDPNGRLVLLHLPKEIFFRQAVTAGAKNDRRFSAMGYFYRPKQTWNLLFKTEANIGAQVEQNTDGWQMLRHNFFTFCQYLIYIPVFISSSWMD